MILVKRADGLNWKSFKFTENVVGVAQNPSNYPSTDQIANGFLQDIEIPGQININPIFTSDYVIPYIELPGVSGGTIAVYEFYP